MIVAVVLLLCGRSRLAIGLLATNATVFFLTTFTSIGYLLIGPLDFLSRNAASALF